MSLNCTICYELLESSENNVYAAQCGHILHYNCWVEWLERYQNCPQCRKHTCASQLIQLYFNTDNGDDYSTLSNNYDSLKCDLQCKIFELEAVNTLVREQKEDIKELKSNILKWERKAKELERFKCEVEAHNSQTKDATLEKFWFNELQNYKEEMSETLKSKDAALKEYQEKLKNSEEFIAGFLDETKPLDKGKGSCESDSVLNAEERRRIELKRLPRGCIVHLPRIPANFKGGYIAIRQCIESLGGSIVYITYKRGDTDAYVRLRKEGSESPAEQFLQKLTGPFHIIDALHLGKNCFVHPRVLEGDEEMDFLKQSLEERDRRRSERDARNASRNSKTEDCFERSTSQPFNSSRGVTSDRCASSRGVFGEPSTSSQGRFKKPSASSGGVFNRPGTSSQGRVFSESSTSSQGVSSGPSTSSRGFSSGFITRPRGVSSEDRPSSRGFSSEFITRPRGVSSEDRPSSRDFSSEFITRPRGVSSEVRPSSRSDFREPGTSSEEGWCSFRDPRIQRTSYSVIDGLKFYMSNVLSDFFSERT